eukprot:2567543-Rhodomonas_salina.1
MLLERVINTLTFTRTPDSKPRASCRITSPRPSKGQARHQIMRLRAPSGSSLVSLTASPLRCASEQSSVMWLAPRRSRRLQ